MFLHSYFGFLRGCYFEGHLVINNLQGNGFPGIPVMKLKMEMIPLGWLFKTLGVLEKTSLLYLSVCVYPELLVKHF